MPVWASTSTVCLTNAASTDHTMAVAAPNRAARRAGEPWRLSSSNTSTARARVPTLSSHWPAFGTWVSGPGDATTRKAASPTQIVRAASQVRLVMPSCIRTARRPSVKISSSTRTGCTTDSGPKYRASA